MLKSQRLINYMVTNCDTKLIGATNSYYKTHEIELDVKG